MQTTDNSKLNTQNHALEQSEGSKLHNASPSGDLQAAIIEALREAVASLGYDASGLDMALKPIPLEGAWGFGSTVAFQMRKLGVTGSPQEVAQRIHEALTPLPAVERVEVVGAYVNFYIDRDWYANRIVSQVLAQGEAYGCWPDRGERVMVEYANLNTHKAMHVGHLRNVVLGATIYNILKCAGFDAVSATYLGDIGMHVIRTLWAYQRFYQGQEPEAETERGPWLETLYVDATARLEYRNNVTGLITDAARSDPSIAGQLTLVLRALAENDLENGPYAAQIAETLTTREGPDWKLVLAERDHIVLNLWAALGPLLIGQTSTLDSTNRDEAYAQPTEPVVPQFLMDSMRDAADEGDNTTIETNLPIAADPLSGLSAEYARLDDHREWWDHVPGWRDEIRQMFASWEAQEPELVQLWNTTREWSLAMFRRIFGDLGIDFHVWFFESEVEEPGKDVVKDLIERGIAEDLRPEGPVIVRVDDQLRAHPELSKKYEKDLWKTNKDGTREPRDAWRVLVVLRSDGTSLYATKDLELARRKFNDWGVDRSIYVIDSRQSLYFQQVFRVLELWGFKQADKSFQLSYEFVNTPEGAISSRKGGAPQYEDLEAEALARARKVVDAREEEQPRDLSDEQRDAIARAVAYGALKMGMLDKDNNKVITFVWEQALNPESQSATYVQYSHARATRVLEKAPAALLPRPGEHYNFKELELQETSLLELVARFPEEVARAAEAYKPVIIAMYCFDLADAFNNFYHNCPILRAGSEEKVAARLALTAAAKQTLANSLGLLGIDAPEMM
ncbi:MAG TPA: arginine--tRNA ligase [Chloroflexia bacterium]|nr:arginine--tRNA ligase [Chloroflexia bacterium]